MVESIQPLSASDKGPSKTAEAGASEAPAPEQPAAAPLAPQVRIEGYIEGVQDRRVFGWAWCRSRPAEPVEVEIRVDGKAVSAVRADRFRPDLAKAGLSEGRHGFEAILESELRAEDKSRLTAHARTEPGEPWVTLVNRTTHAAVRTGGTAETPPSAPRPPSDTQAILAAIAALEKTVAQGFGRLRAELQAAIAGKGKVQGAPDAETDADAQAPRERWASLIASMDVLQTRMDAVCAALQEDHAEAASSRRGDRALMLLVAALGVVSCGSLVLGLFAVFG
jgi:hypothetical protein